ncbi:MAG: DEAD/DEAH box helicase [Tissierellia bacterium]|nr:DEAD/DEAH box helicase [Tissierellia bacterium]
MKIYFSHTGINSFPPEIDVSNQSNYAALIDKVNQIDGFAGLKNYVIKDNKVSSGVRIFVNILANKEMIGNHISYRFYETENTIEVKDSDLLSTINPDVENVLIAIFNAESILKMINNSLTEQEKPFEYFNNLGKVKQKYYKATISEVNFDYDVKKEPIYGFKNGETSLESLKFNSLSNPIIKYNEDSFKKDRSRILPEDLVEAIREIWELPEGSGTLRLFQEDSLFFIMAKLMRIDYPKEKHLLLSMPTGGGKTEAFMIPILSYIYYKKLIGQSKKGIKSIVIYPTNALANDQVMRFVELIYKINQRLIDRDVPISKHISIGILSGDTPNRSKDLVSESLIRICPKCGKSDVWEIKEGKMICKNILANEKVCGTNISSFCRLTREEILDNPPDILITNPDMINFAMHSPRYIPIFNSELESIVFDEVHVYQGVFGCHVSHLLRRLEELNGKKPLYIGMSATIGNAKELASLLFDEELNNIRYIRNENNKYITDKVVKFREHVIITPYYMGERDTKTGGKRSKYMRAMTVAGTLAMFIGHLITDSHFRKSIIFTNYRADADKLASDLRERERLDINLYFDEIIKNIKNQKPLTQEEIDICLYMDRWVHEILEINNVINSKIEVGWNRGGLEKEERIRSIHSFSRNNLLSDANKYDSNPIDIMVATKTLEVGIDIGDVTTIINSSAPFTTNEYVQRVGRAGRKKDSLAITVINPESALDCYMKNNFNNYVYAKESDFEDAPIIVNNEIIIKKHVRARIVDFYTDKLLKINPNTDLQYITIGTIVDLIPIYKNGKKKVIGDGVSAIHVEEYSDCLYEEIFHKNIEGETVAERLISFLKKEERIIDTEPCDVTEDVLRETVHEVIREINIHLQSNSRDGKWEKSRFLVGIGNNAVMPDLTPSLRGAGATVSLYVNNNDTAVDVVPRQTAFSSMPISNEYSISTTISGVSSFKIRDDKGESDGDAEENIIEKVVQEPKAIEYFRSKLDNFPESNNAVKIAIGLKVMVPRKLLVGYFPSRFYCEHCKRGLLPEDDYVEKSDGVYCKNCGRKAIQLHKVYMCNDDTCGHLYDPPIPKMCINPDCPSMKKATDIYRKNNYSFKGKSKEIRDLFEFRLTNDLEWVCKKCGTRLNFSQYYKMKNDNSLHSVKRILNDYTNNDKTSPDYLPKIAKSFPETPADNEKSNKPVFKCRVCNHKNIRPVGVPSVRTISYNFIGNSIRNGYQQNLCDSILNNSSSIEFKKGYVIQLAQEYIRRFSTGIRDNKTYTLKTERIFDKKYWGNYYESHLAWFKFDEKIDKFLNDTKYTCDGNCSTCNKFESLELGRMIKPRRIIEEYNYDSTTCKTKKPDPRGKYCLKALNNDCTKRYCQMEDGKDLCEEFSLNEYLRFIIIHTLKHGILWALPKYAGVSISEIKGEVYPNDRNDGQDLVLIDSNEGGSGAVLLIRKHWDQIWQFANDTIKNTCTNDANIILPHSCSRYNADLCPFITNEFLDYIKDN